MKSRSRFLWNLNKGDDILSFDYDLKVQSVVFVIGAYEGDYLEKLNNKFKCVIYGFEPLYDTYKILENKFKNFENIKLFNIGLSDETKKVKFFISGESSSTYIYSENFVDVQFISIKEFISENKINGIDLVYMNIEGEEYSVLKQLIDSGIIKKIKHLQIQYHKINKGSSKDRKNINKLLSKTHIQKFNYLFIWERWDLKDL